MIVSGYFEKLFSTDCQVSDPITGQSRLVVSVSGLGVIAGHPLYEKVGHGAIRYFRAANLIFDGVEESTRELTDVSGTAPDVKFSKPYIVKDGPFARSLRAACVFQFEGVHATSGAWVDWIVRANSFALEVLDGREPTWARAPSTTSK